MSNLFLRILSAIVLIPPLLALVFLAPPWLFLFIVVLLAGLCGYEYASISLDNRFLWHRFLAALLSSSCAASVAIFTSFPWALLFFLGFILIICPVFFMFSAIDLKDSVRASCFAVTGSLYSGVLTGFIALVFLSNSLGSHWVFTLLLATFLGDTSAYAAGRIAGRRKLAPSISPGKTWAGSFGGFFGTLTAVTISKFFFLGDLSWPEVFLLSVSLSVFCQLGDLAESFFKRGFGVKDSGRIIPGHGGILDRIDALMFGAPVLFFFIMLR
ncbi:MAG: phosphatidate cytidylyltransferase [Proteobacteria bacterium]|nr:phosphatidate cytidylyltransferase [Pseudomonadota bacterium]